MTSILLIEDNPDVRENTAELLSLAGYEVMTARHGKEGVELAQKNLPDLIICDIMMPELDGYGVLHILSKSPDTGRIPFIFLTAKAEKTDVRKGMVMGADDYLTKPFDETDLLNAIETRLKKIAMRKSYEVSADGLNLFLDDARKTLLLEDLCKDSKAKMYKKKSGIFSEGDASNHVYFVKRGSVKTFRSHPDGKELITNLYKENEFFGFESLIEQSPYADSAIALEDSELISISSKDFLTLLHARPEVSISFISLLCKKVAEKESRLLHLAYNSVRQRTAESLLKIWEINKSSASMSVSREDLAKMVGTASESVIRILSEFKDEGLIDIESTKIKILKPNGLTSVIRWNVAKD